MAASYSRLNSLLWILVFNIPVARLSETPFKVTEGSTVILSCHYSVKHYGMSHVCWGRDCGTFWCNDIIVQTDESGVISKVSDRYRLIGDVLSGQMDLGIQRIRQTDSGPYCCRINIDGLFNDKKVTYNLKVIKVAVTTAPTTTTLHTTEDLQTQTGGLGLNLFKLNKKNNFRLFLKQLYFTLSPRFNQTSHTESSAFDFSGQNLTLQNSNPLSDEGVTSLTLQINIPVLSLSLSLFLLLLGAVILLAFKRSHLQSIGFSNKFCTMRRVQHFSAPSEYSGCIFFCFRIKYSA
ncbi:Hepatitis A virus cellular receptor 2 [Bagarius yarrelli]|uniref:Hepatitis A virus cellular receptor 2 n=1 Tax=Bagarius yarrelli TaxID=175774 RepID=A0A556TX87_BAGYA|nr:Hepatitis A virus cellular receptor 2 [Bagarius yarrelli]